MAPDGALTAVRKPCFLAARAGLFEVVIVSYILRLTAISYLLQCTSTLCSTKAKYTLQKMKSYPLKIVFEDWWICSLTVSVTITAWLVTMFYNGLLYAKKEDGAFAICGSKAIAYR